MRFRGPRWTRKSPAILGMSRITTERRWSWSITRELSVANVVWKIPNVLFNYAQEKSTMPMGVGGVCISTENPKEDRAEGASTQ